MFLTPSRNISIAHSIDQRGLLERLAQLRWSMMSGKHPCHVGQKGWEEEGKKKRKSKQVRGPLSKMSNPNPTPGPWKKQRLVVAPQKDRVGKR